ELSLELVNHVLPRVADRLMERLRAAERARHLAEDRCHAQDRGPKGRLRPWLILLAVLQVVLLLGLARYPAPQVQKDAPMDLDANFSCEVADAAKEAAELKRRHDQLQAAFSHSLEAASSWVGFLQRARASEDTHAQCVEAARPGQAALQAGELSWAPFLQPVGATKETRTPFWVLMRDWVAALLRLL
ncbi:unnamed protein product, partial [Effrenium voratum]